LRHDLLSPALKPVLLEPLNVSEANPRQRFGSKATVFAWAEPENIVGLNR
jgi:hypothetical protein